MSEGSKYVPRRVVNKYKFGFKERDKKNGRKDDIRIKKGVNTQMTADKGEWKKKTCPDQTWRKPHSAYYFTHDKIVW